MENDNEMKRLKKLIVGYLEEHTSNPAIKAIEKNIFVAYKLGNVLVTLEASKQFIGKICYKPSRSQITKYNIESRDIIERIESIIDKNEFSEDDINYISHITSKTCSKKCLLPFIENQVNWIVVSLLCASYLSSNVLMRSVFELLINAATTQSGGMAERMKGIPFISAYEKRNIKKTWDELCSWSHPYEKWLKNICPIYLSYKPTYHEKHFENCVNLLEKIMDIFLVVSKEHFGMDTNIFIKTKAPIDLSPFPLFQSRIENVKTAAAN